MWFREKKRIEPKTVLSPEMAKLWGYLAIHYLILATPGFIVFLDEALEVDWKSTSTHDEAHFAQRDELSAILTRAAEVESDDWDGSDEQKTLNLRRQIGEGIARALDGNFVQANLMLDRASIYRANMLLIVRRREAISQQVKIRDEWRSFYKRWTVVHYVIGITALVLSTLVASRPVWLGLSEIGTSGIAWLVAVSAGLLTFLTPDKKADKYLRAWSVLNREITRYFADNSYTVNDVLEACHRGESIIFETAGSERRKRA